MSVTIRAAQAGDWPALWTILEPIIRSGETYALNPAMEEAAARAYWLGADRATLVAQDSDGAIFGTYYLRANQPGGGSHVANCGYMTHPDARGRGIARAMALDSLARAKAHGFTAMQFNFVIASNEAAVALWTALGFATVGRLPGAFIHPGLGPVDALVMHRMLDGAIEAAPEMRWKN